MASVLMILAALFFMTFEKLKTPISHFTGRDISSPVVHLSAAAFGEMVPEELLYLIC